LDWRFRGPLQYLLGVRTNASASESSFAPYVDGLGLLLNGQGERDQVDLALNGGAAVAFRKAVSLKNRRSAGAFFTSRQLADDLLGSKAVALTHPHVVDPACGAGDLLLSAARFLPRGKTAAKTLNLWGSRLVGRDIDPTLIRATRLRLALLASQILGGEMNLTEEEIAKALPEVRVGDGLDFRVAEPVLLLLNPPFGMIHAETDWSSGRTPRAAIFTAKCLEELPEGSTVRAILPDVLRSGTHSREWRRHIGKFLDKVQIKIWGQFDSATDIDVFLLKAIREESAASIDWGLPTVASGQVGDTFLVSVGAVVPHRDPEEGQKSPYICARDLPQGGEYKAGKKKRQHHGKRFAAPFVAIRRTSRPSDGGRRIVATVVRSAKPVLVENHLIVCRPKDRTLASCESLVSFLESKRVSEILDRRIRCRHLTVGAIKELPYGDHKP
jgi:hypothetical protein